MPTKKKKKKLDLLNSNAYNIYEDVEDDIDDDSEDQATSDRVTLPKKKGKGKIDPLDPNAYNVAPNALAIRLPVMSMVDPVLPAKAGTPTAATSKPAAPEKGMLESAWDSLTEGRAPWQTDEEYAEAEGRQERVFGGVKHQMDSFDANVKRSEALRVINLDKEMAGKPGKIIDTGREPRYVKAPTPEEVAQARKDFNEAEAELAGTAAEQQRMSDQSYRTKEEQALDRQIAAADKSKTPIRSAANAYLWSPRVTLGKAVENIAPTLPALAAAVAQPEVGIPLLTLQTGMQEHDTAIDNHLRKMGVDPTNAVERAKWFANPQHVADAEHSRDLHMAWAMGTTAMAPGISKGVANVVGIKGLAGVLTAKAAALDTAAQGAAGAVSTLAANEMSGEETPGSELVMGAITNTAMALPGIKGTHEGIVKAQKLQDTQLRIRQLLKTEAATRATREKEEAAAKATAEAEAKQEDIDEAFTQNEKAKSSTKDQQEADQQEADYRNAETARKFAGQTQLIKYPDGSMERVPIHPPKELTGEDIANERLDKELQAEAKRIKDEAEEDARVKRVELGGQVELLRNEQLRAANKVEADKKALQDKQEKSDANHRRTLAAKIVAENPGKTPQELAPLLAKALEDSPPPTVTLETPKKAQPKAAPETKPATETKPGETKPVPVRTQREQVADLLKEKAKANESVPKPGEAVSETPIKDDAAEQDAEVRAAAAKLGIEVAEVNPDLEMATKNEPASKEEPTAEAEEWTPEKEKKARDEHNGIVNKLIEGLRKIGAKETIGAQDALLGDNIILVPTPASIGLKSHPGGVYRTSDGKAYVFTGKFKPGQDVVASFLEAGVHEGGHLIQDQPRDGRGRTMETTLSAKLDDDIANQIVAAVKAGNKQALEAVKMAAEAGVLGPKREITDIERSKLEIVPYLKGILIRERQLGRTTGRFRRLAEDTYQESRRILRDNFGLNIPIKVGDIAHSARGVLGEVAKTKDTGTSRVREHLKVKRAEAEAEAAKNFKEANSDPTKPAKAPSRRERLSLKRTAEANKEAVDAHSKDIDLEIAAGERSKTADKAKHWWITKSGDKQYEISDEKAELVEGAADRLSKGETLTLAETMTHTELTDGYPQALKDITVKVDHDLEASDGGAFNPDTNEILIHPKYARYNKPGLRRVLLHELNHYVQKEETHVGGAHPTEFQSKAVAREKKTAENNFNKTIKNFDLAAAVNSMSRDKREAWRKYLERQSAIHYRDFDTVEKVAADFLASDHTNDVTDRLAQRQINDYAKAQAELHVAQRKYLADEDKAFRTYLRDEGEANSRNTEHRADWTDAQRAAKPFDKTIHEAFGNVEAEDTINSRKYLGKPSLVPPESAKAAKEAASDDVDLEMKTKDTYEATVKDGEKFTLKVSERKVGDREAMSIDVVDKNGDIAVDSKGRPIGNVIASKEGGSVNVRVSPEHQRKGIATAMYKVAREKGADLGDNDTGEFASGKKSTRSDEGQAFRKGMREDDVDLEMRGSKEKGETAVPLTKGQETYFKSERFAEDMSQWRKDEGIPWHSAPRPILHDGELIVKDVDKAAMKQFGKWLEDTQSPYRNRVPAGLLSGKALRPLYEGGDVDLEMLGFGKKKPKVDTPEEDLSPKEVLRRIQDTAIREQTADFKQAEDIDTRFRRALAVDGKGKDFATVNEDVMAALTLVDEAGSKGRTEAMERFAAKYPKMAPIVAEMRATIDKATNNYIASELSTGRVLSPKGRKTIKTLLGNEGRYLTRAFSAFQRRSGRKWAENRWADYKGKLKQYLDDPSKLDETQRDNVESLILGIDHMREKLVIPGDADLQELTTARLEQMYEDMNVGQVSRLDYDPNATDELAARRDALIEGLNNKRDSTTPEEWDNMAEQAMKELMGLDKSSTSVTRKISELIRDPGTLKERENVHPAIRKALGEITNPAGRVLATLETQAALNARAHTINSILKDHLGTFVIPGSQINKGNNRKQFPIALKGEQYGSLNGYYATQHVADALVSNEQAYHTYGEAWRKVTKQPGILAGKLWDDVPRYSFAPLTRTEKIGSVVARLSSWPGNFGGSALNMLKSGNFSLSTVVSGMKDAGAFVKGTHSNTTTERLQDLLRYANIENVSVAEMQNVLGDKIKQYLDGAITAEDVQDFIRNKEGAASKGRRNWRAFLSTYAMLDAWTKIANYHDRLNMLTEYYKLTGSDKSIEQIKREAGHTTSYTNLSNERVPEILKAFEKRGFTKFVPYFSEVARTTWTNYHQAFLDLKRAGATKNPKAAAIMRNAALKRFLGNTMATAALPSMAAVTINAVMSAFGLAGQGFAMVFNEEDAKKKRYLLSEFNRYQDLLPFGTDIGGFQVLMPVSQRLDPNGPVTDITRIFANTDDPEDTYNEMKRYLSTLLITPLWATHLQNAMTMNTVPKSKISANYPAFTSAVNDFFADIGVGPSPVNKALYSAESLMPNVAVGQDPKYNITFGEDADPAVVNTVAALEKMGMSFEKADLTKPLGVYGKDAAEAKTKNRAVFADDLLLEPLDDEKFSDAIQRYALAERERFEEGQKSVEALRAWKVPEDVIPQMLVDAGWGKEEARNMVLGNNEVVLSLASLKQSKIGTQNSEKTAEAVKKINESRAELEEMGIKVKRQ